MRRKKNLVAVTSVLLSSMLALLALEAVVRLVLPYDNPDTVREHSLEYVPSVFSRHRLRPVGGFVQLDSEKAWGASNQQTRSARQFFVNEQGFRGPTFAARMEPLIEAHARSADP